MSSPSFKIKYANGKKDTLKVINPSYEKVQEFIEEHTGLIYGNGDFYAQTIGMIACWVSNHSPDHEHSDGVIVAATYMIAKGLAERTGGDVVINEKEETLIFVNSPIEAFVIELENIGTEIAQGNYDYSDRIISIEVIDAKKRTKTSIDDLKVQLKDALAVEEYEKAAKLRDKIKKLESKRK